MNQAVKKKSFALGYSLVVHSALTYLVYAAAASTGLNIIVPLFSAKNGLDSNIILTANTVGAFVSCIAPLVFGKVMAKIGIRKLTAASLVLGGILGAILMAYVQSVPGYALCTIFAQCMVHGYCYGATNTLITNWWPRKKGFILGLTTTGIMFASLTAVPLMSAIGESSGFDAMVWFLGGFMIVFGIVSWFWVRDTPEELGLDPDNQPLTEEEKQQAYFRKSSAEEAAKLWPARKILTNRTAWLIALVCGIFLLFTSGVASTTVAFCIEAGYTQPQALAIMSATSAVGVVGSVITGALDTKFGPKITTLICSIWLVVSFSTLLFVPQPTRAMLCVGMANMAMGATGNLTPSLIASCFGREVFAQVYRIVYSVIYFIRSFAFAMLGTGVTILGSYNAVYLVFMCLAAVCIVLTLFINDKKIQSPNGND